MNIILYSLFILISIILIFYFIVILVHLFTGESYEGILESLHRFISNKEYACFSRDYYFINELNVELKDYLGEKTYSQMAAFFNTSNNSFLIEKEVNGLPMLSIALLVGNTTDRQVLEALIRNLVLK